MTKYDGSQESIDALGKEWERLREAQRVVFEELRKALDQQWFDHIHSIIDSPSSTTMALEHGDKDMFPRELRFAYGHLDKQKDLQRIDEALNLLNLVATPELLDEFPEEACEVCGSHDDETEQAHGH